MTLKMERVSDGHKTTIRLIGRMRAEHLEELHTQIKSSAPPPSLDLYEVSLVDREVVRFLAACQTDGVKLLHCSAYIRDWIAEEESRPE